MSDTPRTDKQVELHRFGPTPLKLDGPFADFARGLERENAALRQAGHLAEKIIVQRTDEIRHLESENAALREDKELLDLLNTHCMSADPIMGRSTYRWTIEHDEPDIRAAIAELRKANQA